MKKTFFTFNAIIFVLSACSVLAIPTLESTQPMKSAPAHLPVTQAIRPLWSATLTPQLSGMEFGRVEYGDRVANTIVKGSVYGTF